MKYLTCYVAREIGVVLNMEYCSAKYYVICSVYLPYLSALCVVTWWF